MDANAQWPVWGTTAMVVVTEPGALHDARLVVESVLSAVDRVASRCRPDSELNALAGAGGRPVRVSPLLAELVGAALDAARDSDGDVDPTVDPTVDPAIGTRGVSLASLGNDRGSALIPVAMRETPDWQRITLVGRVLRVPRGVRLDLGATAKAFAADRCARLVHGLLRVGVLVCLGGDIATAGDAPAGGWRVLVQDRPDDPACKVAMGGGTAMATSSTRGRASCRGDGIPRHVLDPRTSVSVEPVWRSVTVAARSCLQANTASASALVRGRSAIGRLRSRGLAARLVDATGSVMTVGDWP